MVDEIKPSEKIGPAPDIADPTGTSEFAQVVQESAATIQAQASEPPKIKRKRGRPAGATARPQQASSAAPGSTTGENLARNAQGQPGAGSPDITKFLMAPLKSLSKIPANQYKVPDLALADDEAFACAFSLQQCFEAFAPQGQMNPKTAAILGALATFGSIGFAKYQIYLDAMAKQKPKIEEPKESENIDPQNPFNAVSAVDVFRRPMQTQ